MLTWTKYDNGWYVDLGFERVPIGCKVDVVSKDGEVRPVKILKIIEAEQGYFLGSSVGDFDEGAEVVF